MVSLATGSEKDIPGNVRFPHKIGRRLTLTLGFLITVVLLVGGLSLYLAKSISQSTDKIKKIGEEIEHIDRAHFAMHHLIEQAYQAIITGVNSEVEKIGGLITQFESEITEYKRMEASRLFSN